MHATPFAVYHLRFHLSSALIQYWIDPIVVSLPIDRISKKKSVNNDGEHLVQWLAGWLAGWMHLVVVHWHCYWTLSLWSFKFIIWKKKTRQLISPSLHFLCELKTGISVLFFLLLLIKTKCWDPKNPKFKQF